MEIKNKRWELAQKAEKDFFSNNYSQKPEKKLEKYICLTEIKEFDGKIILEIGCSPAANIHKLSNLKIGIGLDPLAIHFREFYDNNTTMINSIGENIPLKSEKFDYVFCINVLDHVKSPEKVILEIIRVLKLKGVLLLEVHSYENSNNQYLEFFDKPHPLDLSPFLHFGHFTDI